ncbi:MAG: UDP-N-acetylglucosamine 1-carboxyvinyltransferase [Campylobacter sp.]|nr:UDP-N-acetylglucosamine 1-carboxyvinyltransferase [Campylobacter sp.]
MDYLQIKGSASLSGEVKISGAKNAALPLIALSILSKNEVEIQNLPRVEDVKTLVKLLQNLGAKAEFKSQHSILIDPKSINSTKANYDIVRKMRASILVLGPLLARFRSCEVSLPGGCAIGTRPIDLHLNALTKMGADIQIHSGYVVATAKNALKGTNIVFDKITVTGTENIIMAAALARGETKIINAAKEPEVVTICEVLNASGIKIEGIGTDELIVHGSGGELIDIKTPIKVIPDRIEAGTYLCAGAITNSKITITNAEPNHLEAVLLKLSQMGFGFEISGLNITILPANQIKPTSIITKAYPGFPTDMQAQFMAICAVADGVSTIEERLFENRFMHVSELLRMGADIKLNGHIATIKGVKTLTSADVMATDLRASSALVLAALKADGVSNIHRIYHLDRGYESLETKLSTLGADIKRLGE